MTAQRRRDRAGAKRSSRRAVALASGAVAATLPVLTFLGSAPGLAARAEVPDCGAGAVFAVAGTDDPNHLHSRGLEQRYADQDHVVHRVDYPATFWPLGAQSYDSNIETGKVTLATDVATYQANCPGNPVVIVGYSQGARIAGDVLSEIAADAVDGVSAAGVSGELYSDPRRQGGAFGAGAEVNFLNAYPGAMLDGIRDDDFGDIEVYSVCIDGDPICDLPDVRRDPIGALDALVGFVVKHRNYDAIMTAGPAQSVGADGVTVVSEPDGATVIMIGADPSITTVLAQFGLPNPLRPVILDFPYPELAVIQPISRAITGLLPALPQLGHGAYLTDLYAIRDLLAGDPAAWTSIVGSAVSLAHYPGNVVRDWIAVIDAILDHRDPDLGFIAAPTVRGVAVALSGAVLEVRAKLRDSGERSSVAAEPAPGRHRAPDANPSVPPVTDLPGGQRPNDARSNSGVSNAGTSDGWNANIGVATTTPLWDGPATPPASSPTRTEGPDVDPVSDALVGAGGPTIPAGDGQAGDAGSTSAEPTTVLVDAS